MLKTLEIIFFALRDSAIFDPVSAFETVRIGKREKIALEIDIFAERLAAIHLGRRLRRFHPVILGEESLRHKQLDLSGEERLVALLDVVDGTDLLERGLGNWCSAATFFLPASRQILGAFVGTLEGLIYFWTPNVQVPMKLDLLTQRLEPVNGPSKVQSVADASIAFYGQKLVSLCSNAGPFTHEGNRQLRASGLGLRLYNLAGMPAMVKLVDGAERRRLDAVFEVAGQQPHDVVAGAVIAQQAGATLIGMDGAPVDLASALLRPADPSNRMKYILAATPELAKDLLQCLRLGVCSAVVQPGESDNAKHVAA